MNTKEIIENLKKLDLKSCTEEDILQLYRNFKLTGVIETTYYPSINPDEDPNMLVRASNYDPKMEQIANTNRLKYPLLKKHNKHYQRASTPTQPMFYAVRFKKFSEQNQLSAIKTCLLETIDNYDDLVKEGKRVAISLRYLTEPIHLFSIFSWEEFQQKNKENKEVVESFNNKMLTWPSDIQRNTKLVQDYLSKIFHTPVGSQEHLYKPSAIITQHLFSLPELIERDIDGVLFPSIKVSGKELNVAMIPDKSDQKLRVTKVLDCKYKPNKIVEIQKAANISPNSKIINFDEILNFPIDLKI